MRIAIQVWLGMAGALVMAAAPSAQQVGQPLSLKDAEQEALRNHPAIRATEYSARAAGEVVRETRAAYFPIVVGNLTGAEAQDDSRISAGGLNNPIILDRLAAGVSVSQLVTDFGRTRALVASANLRSEAQQQAVVFERADVLLQVDRAYFEALRAQAVERVARQTVDARQLVVDQVTALEASHLKSSLDVSFASVSLSEAKLLLVQASNAVQAAHATLSATLGRTQSALFEVQDEPLPPMPPPDGDTLINDALRDRSDVAGERLARESAAKFADAQGALWRPTVSVIGAAGLAPYHQAGLDNRYSAIGFNVSVPVSNGHLYPALRAEAGFRANAEEQRYRTLENQVTRDVRIAWLNAQTAFQRLDLTRQLLAQASDALDLAQARYNLGLSSIVELTQGQLNKTQAEIEQATARYEYQARSAALRYETGALK
jgi:outer membrane protein